MKFFKSKKTILPLISLLLVSCSFTLPSSSQTSSHISSESIEGSSSSEIHVSEVITSSSSETSSSEAAQVSDLSIHFLELGNKFVGDSVYIKAGETDILIDAGSRTTSSTALTTYINQFCTDKKLEYVIATHAHQDHIAGFIGSNANPGIFKSYACETIIDFPKTNQTETNDNGNQTTYGRYVAYRNEEVLTGGTHYTALECYNNENGASRTYEVAPGINLSILYNEYYVSETSNENNYSVCLLLSQGENHFLFTGDLEEDGEELLVDNNSLPHVKVFKGGHHGSGTANGDKLLAAITPENVCICTCAGTSEYTDTTENQFPYQSTIDRIAPYTANIYVTTQVDKYVDKADWSKTAGGTVKSMNGNIVVTSTKDEFVIHGSANDTILKETEWFKNNRTWPENGK